METNIAPGLRFSILDREFKKKLEERANRMGLTAVQLRVLGELSRSESLGVEEINQKDLEKALAVTHPTMTEIIKRLEKKHAVICTQSRLDGRYKKINCADEYKWSFLISETVTVVIAILYLGIAEKKSLYF